MGILKKSTPQRREIKIIPEENSSAPLVDAEREPDSAPSDPEQEGQLAVDVFQTAEAIVIVAPIAGVKFSDISIAITDDILTIKGHRRLSFTADSGDYFTKECFWGDFSRSIILPENVDSTDVTASFKNAILTVRVPKVEKIHTRMVKIREE